MNNIVNTLDRARAALASIPPDLAREDWVKAGMGAKAAGLSFEDFDQWSAQGSSYDARAARDTWRSFKDDAQGVGAGSLFYMAEQYGQAPAPTKRPPAPERKPAPGHSAGEVWNRAQPASSTHPYALRKGLTGQPLEQLRQLPEGDSLRIGGHSMAGALLIPAYKGAELQSLQLIPADGPKMNLAGHAMAGASFTVGIPQTGQPLYLCEGVGAAWSCWQATGHAATCCFGWGNVSTVAQTLLASDRAAKLVLVPDVGKEASAADIARKLGCTVATMPEGEAQNFDANDLAQRDGLPALAQVLQAAQAPSVETLLSKDEAITQAHRLLEPQRKRVAPQYPVSALGPHLAKVCADIAEHGQVQPALVGQALLSAAALLTQGLFNVETLADSNAPLSLYLLTLGDSGDGKSTATNAALAPVYRWQRIQAERFSKALSAYQKQTKKERGDESPPQSPYRLISDATIEGLRRDLEDGVASQGVFTDEAAAILSGYGMSAEQRSKTAGTFSKLWDKGHLSVSRASGPRIERHGLRISLHWLIQPAAAVETATDPMLTALGFWPRFLLAWPDPQAPRKARPFKPGELASVRSYYDRCTELLGQQLPSDCTDCPVITLTNEARQLLCQAFEAFEMEARQGALASIKPFALRAAEQTCRIAGVLAAFEGKQEIDLAQMQGALALISYSLQSWQALLEEHTPDARPNGSLKLYQWLLERPSHAAKHADILRAGPAVTRTKAARDGALELLQAAGLIGIEAGEVFAFMHRMED